MRFKQANDAFREEWNVVPSDITKTDKGLLKQMLYSLIQSYEAQNITDLDKYYFGFIECIENVFPDEPWYENIGLDIRMDLFNTRSPEETAQHIVNAITDADAYVEENNVLTEDTIRKSNGKWTNRGDSGKEHGQFNTKKEADAQRKAMYANGFKESHTSNRRLDILFDIIDDSFPEVDDDMLREAFITEAIRLTSIPGVKRDPSNDFSDDGNRFTAYLYKDTVPISYLKSDGDIYLTIAFHHLPDINFREYRNFDSYKVANDFNGVSESSYDADVFAKNLELAYNDIVNFRNNIEDVDEDEIDRRIEEINKSCEEYKEKVKNYLNSRIDKIMNLTPSQFRELQGYVKNAGTSTANYIKDLSQSSKRNILSQDINDLKRNIAHTWNFKYIEELIG